MRFRGLVLQIGFTNYRSGSSVSPSALCYCRSWPVRCPLKIWMKYISYRTKALSSEWLTIPAAAALFLIPAQIVAVLYERGAFLPETTIATAAALAAFAVGLPSFVLIKILQPAFFAREDMKTPMWFSLVSLIVNVVGSLAMFSYLGHVGIALATSLAGWANAILLAIALHQRNDFSVAPATMRRLAMIVVATGIMAGFLLGFDQFTGTLFLEGGILIRLGLLATAVLVGGLIYLVAAFALGGVDRKLLRSALQRR
ncbi:MAG: lipid II flippase MurJ [Pseudomonadota bacterium]